jgi:hypothetical protein
MRMDARSNPYAPGAGTKPPALVGRDREIESFAVLLDRLGAGRTEQSMVITGLRGVGKTVLLNTFEDMAIERDWVRVYKECEANTSLPDVVARHCHRILNKLKPSKRAAAALRGALGSLSAFTLRDPATGFELDFDLAGRSIDTDRLSDDFTDLLLAVGQAALEAGRGVVFLFDEVQYIPASEWAPFVVGLHRTTQKNLPVTCVAVGLPSLPPLTGEAKSYSERLFDFPRIDRLKRTDADAALTLPAEAHGVTFEQEALQYVFASTDGYPFFIQQYGKYAWNVAGGRTITLADATKGGEAAQEALDEGFFSVRVERARPKEREFLRAMADLPGPPYKLRDLLPVLGKSKASQVSVLRDSLIKKGLVYAPDLGVLDFTVPRFDDFMRRTY